MTVVSNIGTLPGTQPVEKPQNRPAPKSGGADFAAELRNVTQDTVTQDAAPQAPVNTDAAAQGLNALINTNLETEAAKLQALQIQQQLGSQTLGIVNQRASTILSLFTK
jgi:hypothetical protein